MTVEITYVPKDAAIRRSLYGQQRPLRLTVYRRGVMLQSVPLTIEEADSLFSDLLLMMSKPDDEQHDEFPQRGR